MNLKPFIAVVTDIKRFDSVYEKKKTVKRDMQG